MPLLPYAKGFFLCLIKECQALYLLLQREKLYVNVYVTGYTTEVNQWLQYVMSQKKQEYL